MNIMEEIFEISSFKTYKWVRYVDMYDLFIDDYTAFVRGELTELQNA